MWKGGLSSGRLHAAAGVGGRGRERRRWVDIERRRASWRTVRISRPPATAPDIRVVVEPLPALLVARTCLLSADISAFPSFPSAARPRSAFFISFEPRRSVYNESYGNARNMLIGLVRDSVLQCFCHSCKAPLGIVGESIARSTLSPWALPSGKRVQPSNRVLTVNGRIDRVVNRLEVSGGPEVEGEESMPR